MFLRRVAIAATIVIVFGCANIFAQPALSPLQVLAQTPPTNSPQKPQRQTGWLKDLNLTREQTEKIKNIRNQSKNQIVQKREPVRRVQLELRDLLAGKAPKEKVSEKYNQLKLLKQQLADVQFENTLAIREILTPEQRQKFAERMYKQ
ncbi:Spy/CpxP family protein refolding chaperone [Calothrix sp. PCC 7507]|uniref:Spy/CpxP family protein refolding chaperone n=1 Tax=Calothrix sp. PCC 7507 TaxID=99598 RepID=UPI00029EE245|nr:Spy/CpxP family protein refolding chaperone [Calothrix sp. PCC 7507]AFY31198.1 protein of unknown function Spy-related protein [Calothrix sp. PCC 7507]